MTKLETLTTEDQALAAMYKADTAEGPLSEEEQAAYQELIADQKASHEATLLEVQNPQGDKEVHIAKSIGGASLHNPYVVHSESWQTEPKD